MVGRELCARRAPQPSCPLAPDPQLRGFGRGQAGARGRRGEEFLRVSVGVRARARARVCSREEGIAFACVAERFIARERTS
jgi:hypothetical protein